MHSKGTDGQQWSIRAEFTVTPNPAGGPEGTSPSSITDKSGIRLAYSWRPNENANIPDTTTNYRPPRANTYRPVEYQRGNLTFTSTPPRRPLEATRGSNLEIPDSGYGSDLLSLNSLASGCSRSPVNPNNRKCRSTCSIVLCSNICEKAEPNFSSLDQARCGRVNSLRCQTPTVPGPGPHSNFYGCGDPWCHHVNTGEAFLSRGQVYGDVPTEQQNANTLPRYSGKDALNYQPSYRRDVSVQTSDSLVKCSAPTMEQKKKLKELEKILPKEYSSNVSHYGQSSSPVRESGEKLQTSSSKRLNVDKRCETSGGHTSDSSKKSRTIHIDVYCTDTEMEQSESSSDSWENESASTPQTVFESENLHATHKRAKSSGLPFKMKRFGYKRSSNRTISTEKDDSEIDDESSIGYPSKIDSYSTINDFSSSISSIKSWKNPSLLSCANDSMDSFYRGGMFANVDKNLMFKAPISGRNLSTHDVLKEKPVEESESYGNQYANSRNNEMEKYVSRNDSNVDNFFGKDKLNISGRDKDSSSPKKASDNSSSVGKVQQNENYGKSASNSLFPILPGHYTERIASRFGAVINIFKKPGRHVGPTKNPDCDCEYCKRHFE